MEFVPLLKHLIRGGDCWKHLAVTIRGRNPWMCREVSMANLFKFLDLIMIKEPMIPSIISIVGIDPFSLQLEELKMLGNTFCREEIAGYIVTLIITALGFPLHPLLNCMMRMPVAERPSTQ
jgi:hypothetical protein